MKAEFDMDEVFALFKKIYRKRQREIRRNGGDLVRFYVLAGSPLEKDLRAKGFKIIPSAR